MPLDLLQISKPLSVGVSGARVWGVNDLGWSRWNGGQHVVPRQRQQAAVEFAGFDVRVPDLVPQESVQFRPSPFCQHA